MAHQLIVSPYPDGHIAVSPGRDGGIRIGAARYAELRDAPASALVPSWLAAPALAAWNLDLADGAIAETIIIRPEAAYGYARASYELNLGCNYDCEHCYLGEKQFAGLGLPGRTVPAVPRAARRGMAPDPGGMTVARIFKRCLCPEDQ